MAIRLANGDIMDAEGNFIDANEANSKKIDESMRQTSTTHDTFASFD